MEEISQLNAMCDPWLDLGWGKIATKEIIGLLENLNMDCIIIVNKIV